MTTLPFTGTITVTCCYGEKGTMWASGYHKGIDLTCHDKSIYSTCFGKVTSVGWDKSGWGQYVKVTDSNGYVHIYAHMVKGSVKVTKGQAVTPTTVLGTMGATGNVTGPHLHYEVRDVAGHVTDPCKYILPIPNKRGTYRSSDYERIYSDWDDIPKWAREAVKWLKERNIMVGSFGVFRPNQPISRAEVAKLIYLIGKEKIK